MQSEKKPIIKVIFVDEYQFVPLVDNRPLFTSSNCAMSQWQDRRFSLFLKISADLAGG